jgi:outer membrane protein assembly factor BamB
LGNKTYALDSESGNFLWSFQTNGYIYSSPAVVDGIAYFGAYDGNFYAVGQTANTSGAAIPNTVYYVIVIVVLIVVIVAAIVMLRKRR